MNGIAYVLLVNKNCDPIVLQKKITYVKYKFLTCWIEIGLPVIPLVVKIHCIIQRKYGSHMLKPMTPNLHLMYTNSTRFIKTQFLSNGINVFTLVQGKWCCTWHNGNFDATKNFLMLAMIFLFLFLSNYHFSTKQSMK